MTSLLQLIAAEWDERKGGEVSSSPLPNDSVGNT